MAFPKIGTHTVNKYDHYYPRFVYLNMKYQWKESVTLLNIDGLYNNTILEERGQVVRLL
jgi:hypothetical protein